MNPCTRIALALLLATLCALPAPAQAGDVSNSVDFTRDVIYQIVTDRFVDGDTGNNPSGSLFSPDCANLRKYCGGDFAGIVEKIEDGYLPQMGISALWISQPAENTLAVMPDGSTSYHGFWARDYRRSNPPFGNLADFAHLVEVAHAHGIKVVIDFTPNHSSPSRQGNGSFMDDGALLDDGLLVTRFNADPEGMFHHNGGSDFSSYENGIYRSLFDLSDYNHQQPRIDAYFKDAITFWLDQGVDGVRVDAIKHMPPGWLKNWVDAIQAHRPVFVFGEWLFGGGDSDPNIPRFANNSGMSLLDFNFNGAIRSVLRERSANWNDFAAMLHSTASRFDQVIDQVTFIDSHDMDRFQVAGASTRPTDMALAVALTSRGTPIVYYGTEQYLSGNGDPANRAMLRRFDRSTRAYDVVRRLSALRRDNPALGFGDTTVRWVSDTVLVYERRFAQHVVLVAISRALALPVDISGLATALPAGSYRDVLGGVLDGGSIDVAADGRVAPFSLGAGEVAVWEYSRPLPTRRFGPVVTRSGNAAPARGGVATTPAIGHVGPMTMRAGSAITLDGEGFGNTPGMVWFGSMPGNVVRWADQRIRVQVPELAGGLYDITVRAANNRVSATYPRFEELSGRQIPVRFIVDQGDTFFGQNLYLSGNVHELSNWSDSASTAIGPMFNQILFKWPTWYYDVSLPAGRRIEFKFVKIDGSGNALWEGGENHVVITPDEGTAEIRVTWQN